MPCLRFSVGSRPVRKAAALVAARRRMTFTANIIEGVAQSRLCGIGTPVAPARAVNRSRSDEVPAGRLFSRFFAARDHGTARRAFVPARQHRLADIPVVVDGLGASTSTAPRVLLRSDVLHKAIAFESTRLARLTLPADVNVLLRKPQPPQPRSWAKRHPVLLGTLVGLGAGYATGWAIGDGRIGDWSDDMNSWVFGAVGAGVGAIVGRLLE